jgi:hypothetical protein
VSPFNSYFAATSSVVSLPAVSLPWWSLRIPWSLCKRAAARWWWRWCTMSMSGTQKLAAAWMPLSGSQHGNATGLEAQLAWWHSWHKRDWHDSTNGHGSAQQLGHASQHGRHRHVGVQGTSWCISQRAWGGWDSGQHDEGAMGVREPMAFWWFVTGRLLTEFFLLESLGWRIQRAYLQTGPNPRTFRQTNGFFARECLNECLAHLLALNHVTNSSKVSLIYNK